MIDTTNTKFRQGHEKACPQFPSADIAGMNQP